jgi:lipopolysaccharide export system protein LptA
MSNMKYTAFFFCATVIVLTATVSPAQERRRRPALGQSAEELNVRAPRADFTCRTGQCVGTYRGEVEVRKGSDLLRADKVTQYKAEGRVVAEGNVIFLQGPRRITGSRMEWDYRSGRIISLDATGFKGRMKTKPQAAAARDAKLEEAIKRAYDLPAELLRKDGEDLNRMQKQLPPH